MAVDVVNNIKPRLSNSLNIYIDTLRTAGNINKCISYNLLINIFVLDWLELNNTYIKEEDINTILSALSCLQGSCTMPYYIESMNENFAGILKAAYMYNFCLIPRKTEDDKLRITEDNLLRKTNINSLT